MSKQYHFVVQFDTDTNEFSLDIDTLNAVFSNGVIFDTNEQEWVADPEADNLEGGYFTSEDILSGWLQKINTEISEEGEEN
jgi:hypothetical protein